MEENVDVDEEDGSINLPAIAESIGAAMVPASLFDNYSGLRCCREVTPRRRSTRGALPIQVGHT